MDQVWTWLYLSVYPTFLISSGRWRVKNNVEQNENLKVISFKVGGYLEITPTAHRSAHRGRNMKSKQKSYCRLKLRPLGH